MNAILPEGKARAACLQMMEGFQESGFIDDGRRIPSSSLMEPGQGKMFGALATYEGKVLRAFSGALAGRWLLDGFVGPCFEPSEMEGLLASSAPRSARASEELWERVRDLYRFRSFSGETVRLSSIAPRCPSGTGDCCEAKLLSAAYERGLRPVSMAQFFYGSGAHPSGEFLPPCDARCKPVLKHIVGLDIIHQDGEIAVVNKAPGLLSIPGRGPEKFDSVASRIRRLFPHAIAQPCVHRLDQGTSGLLVVGLTARAHDRLSMDFERRAVGKEYVALVEGVVRQEGGTIDLPLRLDPESRPRQVVDRQRGKSAATRWERIRVESLGGRLATRLRLVPLTGRTHQLRVHCASGLGHPIVGDALYGLPGAGSEERLMLQASVLEFTHPVTGERMRFSIPWEF